MNENCVDKNGCTEKLEFSLCSCLPKPVSLHNVYILYGHKSIGSNLRIMYWNFNPHKTVHLKTPEK